MVWVALHHLGERLDAMLEIPENGFLFTFPLYSYLIEPGPMPGYLRDPGTGTVFVPVWTDHDLFETYLERSGLAGKPRVSRLIVHSREELIAFLRMIPAKIQHLMIDPDAKAPHVSSVFTLGNLLRQLEKGKKRERG